MRDEPKGLYGEVKSKMLFKEKKNKGDDGRKDRNRRL